MSAYHRFVLCAPPGTVVRPFSPIFACEDEKSASFRGPKKVLRLAGLGVPTFYSERDWRHLDTRYPALDNKTYLEYFNPPSSDNLLKQEEIDITNECARAWNEDKENTELRDELKQTINVIKAQIKHRLSLPRPADSDLVAARSKLRNVESTKANFFHTELEQKHLGKLSEATRARASAAVLAANGSRPGQILSAKALQQNVQMIVDDEHANSTCVSFATRSDADYFVQKSAKFLGISVAVQTPGHLQAHNLIEVHTVLDGLSPLFIGNLGPVRVGDPVFASVPFFEKTDVPIGTVVAGKSDHDVTISINRDAIGTTCVRARRQPSSAAG